MGTTTDANAASALERRADAQRSLQQGQQQQRGGAAGNVGDDIRGPMTGGDDAVAQHAELLTPAVGDAAGDADGEQQQHPEELDVFVRDLLEQMQSRFTTLTEGVVDRIDRMGSRIDDLERSIADLMDQAGVEPPSPLNGTKNNAGGVEHGGGATMSNPGDAGGIASSPDRST